jgi:PAS domain S-box-containing protein
MPGLVWDLIATLVALTLCIGMMRISWKIGKRRLKGWPLFIWGFSLLLLGVLIHVVGLSPLDWLTTICNLGGMGFLLAGLRQWADGLDELDRLEREKEAILNACGNVAIEFLDPEFKVLWANQAAVELYNAGSLEGLQGRCCYQVVRGLKEPCPGCNALEALRAGAYHQSELSRSDGRTFFVQSQPVFDRSGRIIGVVNADTDITDRKNSEVALSNSEEKYRTLVETINEAIFEVDSEGTLAYISPGIHQILGYHPEEVTGKAFIDFVYTDDQQRLIDRFIELGTGIARSSEYRILNSAGEAYWVETFSRPRFDGDRFVGLVGVMTDINQRKLLEAETLRHKQLLEATLNSTADGIMAVDREGNLLTWNHRFKEMWYFSNDQLGYLQMIDGEASSITAILSNAIVGKHPDFFDQSADETKREIVLRDGRIFEVVSCALSGEELTTGQVWNFRDVTSAKQTEAALVRSEEKFSKLFHASPMWSELVSLEDGRFIEVNQAFQAISGFERDAVIGRLSTDIGLWPDVDARHQILAHFENHSRMDFYPCQFRMQDGQIRHFLWSAEVVELENERCLISSLLDVTEQTRMEQALRKSEERYRTLYNNIPLGLFRTTPDGRILSANPALIELFGYETEEEFLAMLSKKMYARAEIREQLIAELDREGVVFMDAIEFRRQDGSTFWATMSAVKVLDQDGNFSFLDGVLQDVSERMRAESAMRASEEKYRLLVDNAHDGIFVTRDGHVRFSNPSTCRILGYTLEEMTAMPLETIVHADDRATVVERHHARIAGENPIDHYTLRALRKSGETLYLELQAVRIEWEDQPAVLCIVRDITERKIVEERLREEKSFSETVINSLPGVFYLYEEDGRLRRWNTNMEKMSGLAPEQLGRMRLLDWFASEDQKLAASVFMDVLEKGEGQAEIPVLTPSGHKRPYFFSGRKLTIQGRSYLLGSGLDFTKRKELEIALRKSERRFRNLVEKMPFGISIVVEDRIIYRNPAQEKNLGKLGHSIGLEETPLPADDLKRFLAACRHAENTAAPVEDLEVRFYPYGKSREPHHLKWMHCSIHPINYLGQKALLISMVDLTRMKELEKQMLIREKMASLGHVAASIAHEIRNPLSGINVLLEGIRENFQEPDSADEIKELLDATQQASDKIAGVIRRVLDFAKPSAAKMEPININAPVRDAIQLTQLTLRRSGIAIEQALRPQLPRLYGDHQLIEQVVINLINNAVAAMEKNENPTNKVIVSSWQEDGQLFLSIADSGPGVPEEMKELIFAPFFTTNSKGSGIGLGFCQRVVSDHGGNISVGMSQWGGADFRICLPLEKRNLPR